MWLRRCGRYSVSEEETVVHGCFGRAESPAHVLKCHNRKFGHATHHNFDSLFRKLYSEKSYFLWQHKKTTHMTIPSSNSKKTLVLIALRKLPEFNEIFLEEFIDRWWLRGTEIESKLANSIYIYTYIYFLFRSYTVFYIYTSNLLWQFCFRQF